MSENIKLSAYGRKKEDTGKKEGQILAEVYGPGFENLHLSIPEMPFVKAFALAEKSSLLDLSIDDKETIQVIVKDFQRDPLSNRFVHIDFYRVREDKKMTTEVEVEPIGQSPAVTNLGGILVKSLSKVNIECLPANLVKKLEVDLSKLETLGQSVRVEDLIPSNGIVIKNDPRAVIFSVVASRKIKEEKPVVAEEKPAEGEKKEDTKADAGKKDEKKKDDKKKK